ncbi:MAG: GNAT family N-acetyltransferase, partial [Elusimicrobiota bacterium]|nr:GNAT family N-acetyltransferase [Elusimicrobiota bacterium]
MKQILELNKTKYLNDILALYIDRFDDPEEYRKFFFKNMFPPMRVFGILQDEKLISMAFVSDKTIVFDNQRYNCPLLSYVATDKNYTHQKNAFNLIEYIKSVFKREKSAGLYLCPVYPKVYMGNSFFPFCYEREIVLHYDGNGKAYTRKANKDDIGLLFEVYNKFMSKRNAFIIRSRKYFETFILLQDIDLIYNGNDCLGYAAYDGVYYEVCASVELLQSVKDFDGKTVSISS